VTRSSWRLRLVPRPRQCVFVRSATCAVQAGLSSVISCWYSPVMGGAAWT
jgi:hypothetical protein